MTTKEVAVDGCVLSHKAGSPISGGSFSITSTPSDKELENGKGAYEKELKFTFSGGSATGFAPNSVATTAPQTINPTADSKMGGEKVMRKGDSVLMNCVGTIAPPATPPTGPIAGDVEISDAGQTNLKTT